MPRMPGTVSSQSECTTVWGKESITTISIVAHTMSCKINLDVHSFGMAQGLLWVRLSWEIRSRLGLT